MGAAHVDGAELREVEGDPLLRQVVDHPAFRGHPPLEVERPADGP